MRRAANRSSRQRRKVTPRRVSRRVERHCRSQPNPSLLSIALALRVLLRRNRIPRSGAKVLRRMRAKSCQEQQRRMRTHNITGLRYRKHSLFNLHPRRWFREPRPLLNRSSRQFNTRSSTIQSAMRLIPTARQCCWELPISLPLRSEATLGPSLRLASRSRARQLGMSTPLGI